jgi:membrane associated rhomboid family serine protease
MRLRTMRILDRLERLLRGVAVPNLTLGLVVAQISVFLVALNRPDALASIELVPARVLEGQVWRPVTFLAIPPFSNPIFLAFYWYLFFLMGTALERYWGVARYNLYLLIGLVASVGVSFLTPEQPVSNAFLQGSVFLAFAFLNPDFELYLFFFLPVRIKWLALLAWIGYGAALIIGDWSMRMAVFASVCNFLLFFAPELWGRVRSAQRRMAMQARFASVAEKPYFHRCLVCGITDRSHPHMDFRYCSRCEGACGYCTDHLANHEHVTSKQQEAC